MSEVRTQQDIIRAMTLEQKYRAAMGLLRSALLMKEASLRAWRPEFDETEIRKRMREYFLYGRS